MRDHLLVAALTLTVLACGGDPAAPCDTDGDCVEGVCLDGVCRPRSDGGGVDAGDAGRDRDAGVGDAGTCAEDCGDGTCIAGACCDADRSCDGTCCGDAQVCSFNRCVDIGGPCSGEEDCGEGGYCEPRLGDETMTCGDAPAATGRCLPRPPTCEPGTTPDPADPRCVASCSFVPPGGALNVVERYAWGSFDGDPAAPNVDDVRNSPIVINLDDDDCDGRITARDVPEIVVITSPDDVNRPDGSNAIGDLVVLGVQEGALVEKLRVPAIANPWTYPAAGEVDGAPGNEIVVCSVDRRTVRAYGVDATDGLVERWQSEDLGGALCTMPSLADLDQDGDVEVITRGAVLDGATGAIELRYDAPPDGHVVVSDVDGDPAHTLEIVSSSRVWGLVGGALVTLADTGLRGNHPIVVQLDGVGNPEIVGMDVSTHAMTVWRYAPGEPGDHVVIRREIDINGPLDPGRCAASSAGRTRGGGPPTAGDVNADGTPDIAVAGGVGYAVLDGARIMDATLTDPLALFFWTQDTVDCSSAQTGSSVFDFNGDGRAEVLYADEHTFGIYRGETGEVLFEACNTNGTILEQPIVADVDGDAQADIVVASNARYRACLDDPSTRTSGIRVYGSRDGDWVRTRRVWNQHAYHITNVEEDGTIPRQEAPSWLDPELNNFRLNRQPGNALAAVDAVVALEPRCTGAFGLFATVRNLGESVLPAGATVRIYRGAPSASPPASDALGELVTTRSLFPAQSERLVLTLDDADARAILLEATEAAFAVVDVPAGVQECRSDNVGVLERTCSLM